MIKEKIMHLHVNWYTGNLTIKDKHGNKNKTQWFSKIQIYY